MRIPARNLLLLAQAPASAGEATWDYWVPPEIPYFCGQLGVVADRGEIAPPDERYYAIVLRSENQAGKSAFVVADTVKNADYTC
jgi:hypothetical protein